MNAGFLAESYTCRCISNNITCRVHCKTTRATPGITQSHLHIPITAYCSYSRNCSCSCSCSCNGRSSSRYSSTVPAPLNQGTSSIKPPFPHSSSVTLFFLHLHLLFAPPDFHELLLLFTSSYIQFLFGTCLCFFSRTFFTTIRQNARGMLLVQSRSYSRLH
jgi:hypothetical protein